MKNRLIYGIINMVFISISHLIIGFELTVIAGIIIILTELDLKNKLNG